MNDTNSDDVTGLYCTNCEAFIDYTGQDETECPECQTASVAYVVLRLGDKASITNTPIPDGAEKITLEAARGDA